MATDSGWRLVASDEDEPNRPQSGHSEPEDRVPRWMIGAAIAIVGAACAVAIWMTLPAGGVSVDASGSAFDPRAAAVPSDRAMASPNGAAAVGLPLIVDVEGAVVQPGLHQVADGSRVGDAIAAAGGYAPSVDIEASGRDLNLAARVSDGEQIRVPALGDAVTQSAAAPSAASDGSSSSATGGLIDLNHATAEELDTLPGIGPVTAAKIIDARTQALFATVDELQSRGVVGQATFDKLRDLVTTTP